MFPHCSSSQRRYFFNEYLSNDPLGYLVANALYGNSLMKTNLSDRDIDLHMTIADLCMSLTKSQKEKLAKSFSIINDMLIERNCFLFSEKKIPTTYNSLSTTYINGANSIMANMPVPDHESVDNHSYTPLLQCVADVLGHLGSNIQSIGQEPASTNKVSLPHQSKRAYEIFQLAHTVFESLGTNGHVVYLYEWSDGFEPTTSSKNNRGGAWVKTVTIGYQTNDGIEKENTTP